MDSGVDQKTVRLSVEKQALESLPDYRSDPALAVDIDNALWADDILRATDYDEINVTVQDGIVRLRGSVITSINKSRAEAAVCSIPGVLDIENHLVVDDELAIDVAQALARDARTRLETVTVGAHNGVIALYGRVANAVVREVAEEVAANVPQVRGIINCLQAPGGVVNPKDQQILQPPIGQAVYTTDMRTGIRRARDYQSAQPPGDSLRNPRLIS